MLVNPPILRQAPGPSGAMSVWTEAEPLALWGLTVSLNEMILFLPVTAGGKKSLWLATGVELSIAWF